MLQLDDVQLYDLSEAGALLFSDPARLRRQARLQQVPSARVDREIGLPAPWVEAESGRSGADPVSLRTYWLGRLAPPAGDARRPVRGRDRLPRPELLDPDETARRLHATARALRRLTADGTLPGLRVDGALCFDAELVDLVARQDEDAAAREAAAGVRALLCELARFEYRSETEPAPESPAAAPAAFSFPSAEPAAPATPGPGADQIPDDLGMDAIEPLDERPPSTLIDVDGFETIDED
jgi:hypothetical protein